MLYLKGMTSYAIYLFASLQKVDESIRIPHLCL